MSDKIDIKILAAAINEVLDNRNESVTCVLGIEKDDHEKEHRFLKSMMGVSEKIDNIKWVIFSDTVKTLWRMFIACVILGIIFWIKHELK